MIDDLRTNRLVDPLGIDSPRPIFSWLPGDDAATGWELQVAEDSTFDNLAWATAEVTGTPGIRYEGSPLHSRQKLNWRVRELRDGSSPGAWSSTARFEMGLLAPSDWTAEWITDRDDTTPTTHYFRGAIELPHGVRAARAYASALGWYRLFVNGVDVTGSDQVPRWTPFDSYVEYQVYDIAETLRAGENIVGVVVSEGRFRGKLGGLSLPKRYGDQLAAIAQIEVQLDDGTLIRRGSDQTWLGGRGRIRSADPKHGERVDFRLEDDWRKPGRPPAHFAHVETGGGGPRTLISEEVERVTEIARIEAVSVSRSPTGAQLVDFGQNFSGVAETTLRGRSGDVISLSYGEVLTPDGELDTTYLGNKESSEWYQKDEVILGDKPVSYRPRFSVHGFRYVSIDGLSDELRPGDMTGIVVSTALRETASFSCSDPRLERLHQNVVWSMRSNFTDTPSDCPTRERSGWTGDIQVFGPAALTLADTDAYLRRFLRNMAVEQKDDGRIPVIIPSESSTFQHGLPERLFDLQSTAVGWGDVSVLLPWQMYLRTGDEVVLENAYPAARKWVDGLVRRAATKRSLARRISKPIGRQEQFILDTGFQYGEWLRPGENLGAELAKNLLNPPAAVATAYLAHSAAVLAGIAQTLGEDDDAAKYASVASSARAAWNRAFVSAGGSRIGSDKQDDYVRGLAFDLLPESHRATALERLVQLISDADGHLGTGFLSTALLLATLSRNGRADVALRILMQTTSPSWLAQLAEGATTIWETWEGYGRDGKAVRSHNHYALGSVVTWLHEDLAGLRPTAPGYRRMTIDPTIGAGLTSASSRVQTPYGPAESSWILKHGYVTLSFVVPHGCTAEVRTSGGLKTYAAGAHVTRYLDPGVQGEARYRTSAGE